MLRNSRLAQVLVALFLAGFFALNYPLVSVVDLPNLVFGIPLSYLSLFVGWALLLAAVAWMVERGR